MQTPSQHNALSSAPEDDTAYNAGEAGSIVDEDVTHPTVLHSGNFSGASPQFRQDERPGKLIQDRVHEYVRLPMIAIRIIDTPEFQRLRSLKQLGTTVFLYPGATHSRFEHSIGVAHLASEMVCHIARGQPELGITSADITCVTIAGLCHDIGHGPFSHLFEQVVDRLRQGKRGKARWCHEEMSVRLLRRILACVGFASYGLSDEDARFVELCISGLPPRARWPSDVGRPPLKRFLVDIVANKRSGLDVDKLDYFLRDSLGCHGRAAVDVHIPRLLSACKVMCLEGEYQICFEEKMALSLGDLFNLRAKLHKHVYQRRIANKTKRGRNRGTQRGRSAGGSGGASSTRHEKMAQTFADEMNRMVEGCEIVASEVTKAKKCRLRLEEILEQLRSALEEAGVLETEMDHECVHGTDEVAMRSEEPLTEDEKSRDNAVHTLVESFHSHATELGHLHDLYAQRLGGPQRQRSQVRRTKLLSSTALMESTLVYDIIDFMIDRSADTADGVTNASQQYSWNDIEGLSSMLRSGEQWYPPLVAQVGAAVERCEQSVYHNATFLSSDDSDEENFHYPGGTRRRYVEGRSAGRGSIDDGRDGSFAYSEASGLPPPTREANALADAQGRGDGDAEADGNEGGGELGQRSNEADEPKGRSGDDQGGEAPKTQEAGPGVSDACVRLANAGARGHQIPARWHCHAEARAQRQAAPPRLLGCHFAAPTQAAVGRSRRQGGT